MSIEKIRTHFKESLSVLQTFLDDDVNFQNIERAGQIIVDSLAKQGKVISCGNGGSMSDAMHFAEELTGRFREDRPSLAAIAISDPSYISCVANDYGYDKIFSRYVEGIGNVDDVLLAISTSGNSTNVLEAAMVAQSKGMKVIALTGKDGGKLSSHCDIEIRAPYSQYADRVQEIHIKVIHSLIDFVEEGMR